MIANNNLNKVLETINKCSSAKTGFLPDRTPLVTLPIPYNTISEACNDLANNYHGEEKNCRHWLENIFQTVPSDWINKLDSLNNHELEALMTKISLLCHAFRWGCMPAKAEEYNRQNIILPHNLKILWKEVSKKLGIPMVGNFYTIVTNNWRHIDLKQNKEYDANNLKDENIEIIHSWLNDMASNELRSFIVAALGMESQGKNVLTGIKLAYAGIIDNNIHDILKGLEIVDTGINNIILYFNQSIKQNRIDYSNFLKIIQPTMIWLIDDIEGANGTQCCTIQAIDSFLGIQRKSLIGQMITRSREYMLPKHLELLNALDTVCDSLKEFIQENDNEDLNLLYNNCIKKMITWRKSHKHRGANYLKGDINDTVDHYISTGLAVKEETDRVTAYKNIMESHIIETNNKIII